jgi:hypothetical protein
MFIATADTVTFVVLNDGRVLKIAGTGGTGTNMFNVNSAPQYHAYVLGTQAFNGVVSCLAQVGGSTLIGFCDGRLLKVKGTGGSGSNMFAVTDNGPGKEFGGVAGFHHYEGGQVFPAGVAGVYPIPEGIFLALIGGRLLKVKGAGGTGMNMLNINSDPHYTKYILGVQEQFTPYTPTPQALLVMALCDAGAKLDNQGIKTAVAKCIQNIGVSATNQAGTMALTTKDPRPIVAAGVLGGFATLLTDDNCKKATSELYDAAQECLNEGHADSKFECGPGCEAVQKDLNDQIGGPIHFNIPNPGPAIGPVYPGETHTPGEINDGDDGDEEDEEGDDNE